MGTFYASTLTVADGVISGTLKFDYPTVPDYKATKKIDWATVLAGEYTEEFADGSFYGNPAKGTLTVAASDNSDYDLQMTFFGGTSAAVTVYANVSEDGTTITTVQPSGYTNMGTFYASTLTVAGNVISGTLNFDYPTVSDYTATKPGAEEPVAFAERVAAYYSNGTSAWCSFIPGIANRTMAADGKYVYLQSSEADPKVYAVEMASLLAGAETPAYKALSTANMSGGTHAVSALRCIPNEAGDPILIATNLASDSQNFNIYAYSNGTDADPVLFHAYRWDGVANVSDWRRYGDRIAVSGTWQNGKIYAASQSGTKVMAFGIKDGATSSDQREYCWFDTFGGGLAEAVVYPGTTEAILTTATSAGFWTPNTAGEKHSGGFWPKWDVVSTNPELNGAFSFQFFTHNEKKYIAYVQLPDNTHCDLVVVEDLGSFATSLASEPVFTAPLYEGDAASCAAGNTYGDCAVVEVEGALHIVAQMQGGGLSIFKLN